MKWLRWIRWLAPLAVLVTAPTASAQTVNGQHPYGPGLSGPRPPVFFVTSQVILGGQAASRVDVTDGYGGLGHILWHHWNRSFASGTGMLYSDVHRGRRYIAYRGVTVNGHHVSRAKVCLYGTVTRVWDVGEPPLPGYTRMRLTVEVPNGIDFLYFHNGVLTKSEGQQQVCPSQL
jgi:hypothetical protein